MKCPKCGQEMEAGFLQSEYMHGITWVSKILPFGAGYWKKDAVHVSSGQHISVDGVPTHICKRCKLLLGDYSGKQ